MADVPSAPSPIHVFPVREDLVAVAASFARSVRADLAALALDPGRFAAGTVGSPGVPATVLEALRSRPSPADDAGLELVSLEGPSEDVAESAAQELRDLGLTCLVRVPLRGPGGVIGLAELYFEAPVELTGIRATEISLHAEHAAMNVVNVRLFSLVERAKKEWEGTFDAIRDGISIHDADCRIRRANWGLGAMLNTTPSRLVGQTCQEAIYSRTSPCRDCPLLPHGSAGSFKARERDDEIDGLPVHVSLFPLVLEDGSLSGLVHIVRDISEKRREEEQFRRMHEELVTAHGDLQASMNQLKSAQAQLVQSEKMAAVGQLISGVAHELNNPLTGIIGYSQLIGDADQVSSLPIEKLSRYVQNMGKEAVRCQKIVKNLLTFARKDEPEKRRTDLNEVVRRTVDLKAYELRVNDIEIHLELHDSLPSTMADQNQLQQVLLNLLQNASQAIRDAQGRGRITIRTRVADAPLGTPRPDRAASSWLVVEVEDDGPGFTDDVKARMFDPFFTTKEVGQGTGLGLSICYGIVREHEGYISAEAASDGGALFRLELPVAGPHGETAAPEPTRVKARAVAGSRVLVVDDEATICDMVRDVLVLAGHVVDTARNGRAGVQALETSAYDCVLVDLKMPEIDGPALHAHLAERDPEAAARMIFMTGDMLSEQSRRFLEKTGNPYLAKPFSLQELREKVAQVLAASQPARPRG